MEKTNMIKMNRHPSQIILICVLCLSLFAYLQADSKQCVWKNIDSVIAVGDIHGDYDNFVKILKSAGLVDDALHWTGGKTHFVQTGDIMDRGDGAKKVFDLLMRLQKEAEEAGGKIHVLLGNHEEMNITGTVFRYPQYVSPKQFASFLPDSFREKKEDEFKKQLQNLSEIESNSDPTLLESYLETKWNGVLTNHSVQKLYVDTFNKNYGKWIIKQNIVIKINDILFCHGGISERYAKWPLPKINEVFRKELNSYRIAYKRGIDPRFSRQILYYEDSPLWNRDLALKDEKSYSPVVDKILKTYGANYMVIAHTPPGSPVVSQNDLDEIALRTKFDKKVWMIDTGIADYYYGILSYFYVENGIPNMKEWREAEPEEETTFEPSDTEPSEETSEDVEYFLENATVVNTNIGAVPGRTAAWKVDLDDGKTKRRAMFKVISDRRPALLPESYKYELAAYAMDRLTGFDRIPPMVKRQIRGITGSLQIRIEDCFSLDEQQRKNLKPPDSQAFADALEEINVFENLVYDKRNDLDDILIKKENWDIFRVDFSEAFEPSYELISEQKITRCSKKLFKNLQDLTNKEIEAKLEPYLNDEEILALITRKARIIRLLKKLIKEKGEEAILF
jgi:hypothetical protein